MKILLMIIDGLGDRPIPRLKNKTPLEAAKTPNLDYLAKVGICGQVQPVYTTVIPTSEETHFSLFGYDPKVYRIRRGIFTAMGAGIKLKPGDVALRGNFGTIGKNLHMIDRRAGRIRNTQSLIKSLNGMVIDGVKFLLKSAGEYRVGIVLRTLTRRKHLSSNISDGDPHYGKLGKRAKKIVPLDKSSRAKFTAKVLNKFLCRTHQVLENHPANKRRKRLGLLPANYLLVRRASSPQKIPSFLRKYKLRACCIAGKPLYKQIGKFLGMTEILVRGANGLPSTNIKGKVQAAKRTLKRYDFVFLHIKATDSLAEDGNFLGKKKFIEKIDKNIKPLFELKDTLIIVTADHSTCCLSRRHCRTPVPILVYGVSQDSVKKFSEKACKKGKLGKIKQTRLMLKIIKLAKNE